MTYLTRDEILAAKDIQTEEVDVPEWGGSLLVRGLTGVDRDEYETSLVDLDKSTEAKIVARTENMRAKLASRGIVDESGDRLFTVSDIEALGQKSAIALDRICDVIKRLSGMGKEAEKEALKNS